MTFEKTETLGNNERPHRFVITTDEKEGNFQSVITFENSKLIGPIGASIKEAISLARDFAREITYSHIDTGENYFR